MKIIFIVLSSVIGVVVIYFFILGMNSKTGEALGLIDGRLSKCSNKPNCVCSEEDATANHYIKPIELHQNNISDNLNIIKDIIQGMDGSITLEKDQYLAATFTSGIFGFVDDLEIRIDTTQKVMHIRSASRVGRSDFGVNKKRLELLKRNFNDVRSE